jgi:hypothetical protein
MLRHLALVALLVGSAFALTQPRAMANQSPQSAYCVNPNAITNGQPRNATPLMSDLSYLASCAIQPGDIFTDGPFYSATFTFSGSLFTYTIPANVWSVLGQRVYTNSSPETANASSTNYVWLDCNSCSVGTWEFTTANTAPDAYAVLMYYVVANGSGITAVTFPTPSSVILNTATFGSSLQASTIAGSPNQAVISAISPSQILITNPSTPFSIGSGIPIVFNSSAPQCADSSSTQATIAEFLNGDTPPESPLVIGCSTNASDTLTPAIQMEGQVVLNGLLILGNVGFQNRTLVSSSVLPKCASNAAVEAQCGAASIPNADLVTTPYVSGSAASLSSITDTGLGSATVGPLCGASATAQSQCTPAQQTTTKYSSGGTTVLSVATGTTQNAYQTLGSVSVTTGTSNGSVGAWYGMVISDISIVAPLISENVYGCIISSSTFTTESQTTNAGATVCQGSPSGAIAGAPVFGLSSTAYSAATNYEAPLNSHIMWSGQVANATTFAATCKVAGSSTSSITVFGGCTAIFWAI